MSDYEFGQKVEFVWPLGRVHTDRGKKEWQDASKALFHPLRFGPKPTEGIVIGKRTLSNGRISYEEWGVEFCPEEYFPAYLIAFDMQRKPVYVKPENVSAL